MDRFILIFIYYRYIYKPSFNIKNMSTDLEETSENPERIAFRHEAVGLRPIHILPVLAAAAIAGVLGWAIGREHSQSEAAHKDVYESAVTANADFDNSRVITDLERSKFLAGLDTYLAGKGFAREDGSFITYDSQGDRVSHWHLRNVVREYTPN